MIAVVVKELVATLEAGRSLMALDAWEVSLPLSAKTGRRYSASGCGLGLPNCTFVVAATQQQMQCLGRRRSYAVAGVCQQQEVHLGVVCRKKKHVVEP